MKPTFNAWLWLGLVLPMLFSACKKEKEPAPVNKLAAAAGTDQTVLLNTPVQLDGSASRDGNGKAFSYAWRFTSQPGGSRAALTGATTSRPTFTPDQAGAYVLELKIINAGGQSTDAVTITATAPAEPAAGIINADIFGDRHLADIFTDPARADYLVTADVKVGGRLSLAPGVVVAFEAGTGLVVLPEGSLTGKGTAERPVVFTGKSQTQGYWKGLWVYSNSPHNELDYATVAYGGSQDLPGNPGTRANLILVPSALGAASLKVTHSRFTDGGGYGLYVYSPSQLAAFAGNAFSDNAGAALFAPADQVHKLDPLSRFAGNNGFNGVETRGTLQPAGEVAWPVFADGSAYYVSGSLTVASGLSLAEGTVLRFITGAALDVDNGGFLEVHGTAYKPVVFTAATPAAAGNYWGGIFVKTASERNQLHYAQVSYAGGKDLPGYPDARGNVVVGNAGKLSVRHSTLSQGPGWGVVAYTDQGAQLNADAATINRFNNLARGNVKLTSATAPLAGDWLDAWSFARSNPWTDKFYDRVTSQWFNAAADPWTMTPQGGFGLRIAADGSFVWTIAEHGPAAGCGNAYSAEYIVGKVASGDGQLTFTEHYWRSKFHNPCDPGQSADQEITPGTTLLRYDIYPETAPNGTRRWVLKLINPDNTSFLYYRAM